MPETTETIIQVPETMRPLIDHMSLVGSPELEAQLVEKSKQPAILHFTPRDASRRYTDLATLRAYLPTKGRIIHWLVGKNGDLAGIICYRNGTPSLATDLPEMPTITFTIRLYEGYAGHGLARPFMRLSLRAWAKEQQTRGEIISGIWLKTTLENAAAIAVYTKFGYQEVARDDDSVTMVLSATAISELLSATSTE